ncbi:MAG: ferric uptake regulation protein [Spirochaetes bacterium DG_61]|jgi:Fur family ferric uptake transcriptional regulator|nr:MAG: ferric uptake regulation protein [Spirochaetes bacterium DG_61]
MKHGWYHGRFMGEGYRFTIPRQAILEVLSSMSGHLSAEDIYLEVHKRYPAIGLTTVYRTLELLERMGLVLKFDFGDKRARFELYEGPGGQRHHHHLVCNSCGRIIDYTDYISEEKELLQKAESGLSKKYNFQITNHVINFYGLCDRCRSESSGGLSQ